MKSELNALLYGDFTPDPRTEELNKRLYQYYKDTYSDSMDNKTAMVYWKEFKQWCGNCGYTPDEVNRAKRIVSGWDI